MFIFLSFQLISLVLIQSFFKIHQIENQNWGIISWVKKSWKSKLKLCTTVLHVYFENYYIIILLWIINKVHQCTVKVLFNFIGLKKAVTTCWQSEDEVSLEAWLHHPLRIMIYAGVAAEYCYTQCCVAQIQQWCLE